MTNEKMVAVFDLGSARVKLLTAMQSRDGKISFARFLKETHTAAGVTETGVISQEAQAKLVTAVDNLVTVAKERGCDTVVAVGTDVFRRVRSPELNDLLQDRLGPVTVLSPTIEGAIFYSAAAEVLPNDIRFCAIDVGGSSVQVAWGARPDQVVSMPTGTFQLEREFQPSPIPNEAEYARMRHKIENYFRAAVDPELDLTTMVFGSNCMQAFLQAALAVDGKGGILGQGDVLRTTLERLEELFAQIKGRPYEELSKYFPDNPDFMRGADKALLNVLVVGSILGTKWIIPTNESVGTAIARIALTDPGLLAVFGIVPKPLP